MAQLIQLRRGTEAQWTSANPILASGEKGIETDTGREKTGNGVDAWEDLPYFGGSGGGGGGAVDSVNGEIGVVVLNTDDISDTGATNKYVTSAEKTKLSGIETGADVTDTTNVAAAGAAMRSENLSDLDDAATARSNLGLGALASADSIVIYHDVYLYFSPDAVEGDVSTVWPMPRDGAIVNYHGQVDDAPATASIILDLEKDGLSIMDDPDRVIIPTSGFRDTSGTPLDVGTAADSLMQIRIVQLNAADEGNVGNITCRITWAETVG